MRVDSLGNLVESYMDQQRCVCVDHNSNRAQEVSRNGELIGEVYTKRVAELT